MDKRVKSRAESQRKIRAAKKEAKEAANKISERADDPQQPQPPAPQQPQPPVAVAPDSVHNASLETQFQQLLSRLDKVLAMQTPQHTSTPQVPSVPTTCSPLAPPLVQDVQQPGRGDPLTNYVRSMQAIALYHYQSQLL